MHPSASAWRAQLRVGEPFFVVNLFNALRSTHIPLRTATLRDDTCRGPVARYATQVLENRASRCSIVLPFLHFFLAHVQESFIDVVQTATKPIALGLCSHAYFFYELACIAGILAKLSRTTKMD